MNKIALSVENLTKVYSNAKSKNSKINALNNNDLFFLLNSYIYITLNINLYLIKL